MTLAADATDPTFAAAELRRFTVQEYHDLRVSGVLRHGEPFELLEGLILKKPMSRDPVHDAVVDIVVDALKAAVPEGWGVRAQSAITTSDSEPEPDVVLYRGRPRDYLHRHPGPADVALVVEVANTSLKRDRETKARVNARAGVPEYWIVNLAANVVERYTRPELGPGGVPAYLERHDLAAGDILTPPVPGATSIAVRDILP